MFYLLSQLENSISDPVIVLVRVVDVRGQTWVQMFFIEPA